MGVKSALLSVLELILVSSVFAQSVTKCTDTGKVCFTIHQRDQVTWQKAYDACLLDNSTLAIVTSVAEQSIVRSLVVGSSTSGHAWIAGRRSEEEGWRDMNLQQVSGVDMTSNPTAYCTVYHSDYGQIFAEPCRIIGPDLLKTTCQLSLTSGACPAGTTKVSDSCVFVPQNWTNSWMGAQLLCQTYFSQPGILAYSSISNPDFKTAVQKAVSLFSESPKKLWIGIKRRPWTWVKGQSPVTLLPMMYHAWYLGKDLSDTSSTECLSVGVSSSSTGEWAPKPCDTSADHYICVKDKTYATQAESERSTASIPDTEGPVETPEEQSPTPGKTVKEEGLSRVTIIIIVCVCSVVAFLVILVVIIVIIIRRRRRQKSAEAADGGVDVQGTDYPRDTYRSTMSKVSNKHKEDRELEPVDLDLVRAADSVRHAKPKSKPAEPADSPRYNDVFMYDE